MTEPDEKARADRLSRWAATIIVAAFALGVAALILELAFLLVVIVYRHAFP